MVWTIRGVYLAWFDQSEGCTIWTIRGLYLACIQSSLIYPECTFTVIVSVQRVLFRGFCSNIVLLQSRKLYSLQSGSTYRFKGHPAELCLDESPGVERVWVGGEKLHHLWVETEVLTECWELLPEAEGKGGREGKKEGVKKKLNKKRRNGERESRPWHANMSFVLVNNSR